MFDKLLKLSLFILTDILFFMKAMVGNIELYIQIKKLIELLRYISHLSAPFRRIFVNNSNGLA